MQLSPYEQYYVRKLLRYYINQLNYPMFGIAVCAFFQTDLNQLLRRFEVSNHIIQDLRTLIQFHQAIGEANSIKLERPEIEQKMLWILGLKFLVLVANTSTVVISESSVSHFKFTLNGQIYRGIRDSSELYGMCLEFGAELDFSASRLLLTLINRSIPFVLTVSEQQHIIWISLRSQSCRSLLSPTGFLSQSQVYLPQFIACSA